MEPEKLEGRENFPKEQEEQFLNAPTKSEDPVEGRKPIDLKRNEGLSVLRSDDLDSAVNLDNANTVKLKPCGYCRNHFEIGPSRRVYCCDECRRAGHKIKAQEWKARNKNRLRNKARIYYRKNKAKHKQWQRAYYLKNNKEINKRRTEKRKGIPLEERRVNERSIAAVSQKSYTPFSENEDIFLMENFNKMDFENISRFLNRSIDSVKHRCRQLSLKKNENSY